MRPNWITCLITAGILMTLAIVATAQDVEHGRISYVDNDALIRGNEDAEWSVAQQNSLVMPGDTIWADEQGVLEVEVSGGTFIRLADGSKMDVESMPPSTIVKGWAGSFYIHRLRYSEGDMLFQTPVGDILIEKDSQVRIDILAEGSTTVSARWGNAVIRTADGLSVRVPSGQQVFIDPGYAPSSPVNFDRNIEDPFDTWNRERSRQIAKGSNSNKIGQVGTYAAPIGTTDLEEYGEWVYVDNRSYWKPTVVVGYVPYRAGNWSYVPNHGHVWVGYHPFTYVTSHHGYWRHHHHHGWIWSYNHAYSPAYVASVRYNDNFIWAPMSRYGDAVHISGSYFTAGGFHFSIGYTSYTHSSYIYGGYYRPIYPMHHNTYFSHHNYYNAHHWNPCHKASPHYNNRPQHFNNANERHYTPQRYMRGPSEVRLASGASYSAPARARSLEGRTLNNEFVKIAMNTERGNHRTPTLAQQRTATTRPVNFNEAPINKMARRDDRMRNINTTPLLTNRPTGNTGGTNTPTISSRQASRPTNSSTPTQPQLSNRNVTRTSSGSTPRNMPGEHSATIPQRPTITSSTPIRPNTREFAPSISTHRGSSNIPQVTSPRTSTPTRPQATTTRPSISTRPQATTTRPSAPSRPQATTPRPQTSFRPQASAPRQSAPSRPQTSSPRQSAPSRPQTSAPRQSAPSRPQTSAPRQSAPRPSTSSRSSTSSSRSSSSRSSSGSSRRIN